MWHGSIMSPARFARSARNRGWLLIASAGLAVACSQPPQKPKQVAADSLASAPEVVEGQRQSPKTTQPSKVGTVGLIRELKDRGMTTQNWAGIIGSIFTNEAESDVIRVRYEVTVFYKDGTQGVLIVDQRPGVQTGERVRVTGNQIDSLDR